MKYLMMSETDLMIIECFGPTGAGKTTFALALEARLRSTRLNVFTMLSAQPREQTFIAADNNNAISGLFRPTNELMNIARQTARKRTIASQQQLLLLESIRASIMRRYLKRLSRAWANAAKSDDIWIFDQAYVQAISSILRVQPRISDNDIIALLALVPRSDLVVCIDTPVEDLKARLKQRRRVYDVTGMVVQEPNIDIPIQVEIAKLLFKLMNRSDRYIISVGSASNRQLEDGVKVVDSIIDRIIEARRG